MEIENKQQELNLDCEEMFDYTAMPEYKNTKQPEPKITATFKFRCQEDYDKFHDLVKKYIYEGKIKAPEGESKENWVEREQLLFKSTDFGDDKDRALQKEDKSWTYFASDVAYHNTKLKLSLIHI